MSQLLDASVAGQARAAIERHAWGEAFELLSESDRSGGLDADSLQLLATAAYVVGQQDISLGAGERAHAAYVRLGNKAAAAGTAVRLSLQLVDAGRTAPVRGWIRRAERLLQDQPVSADHAVLAVTQAYAALMVGDLEGALAQSERLSELGESLDDPAARALGQHLQGRVMILRGNVAEGLALLDEAAVAAVSGELDPLNTAVLYCSTICASQSVGEYGRAEEWTEAMTRWSRARHIGTFHGRCRVHRAEILRLRGAWQEAEGEAQRACDELRPYVGVEVGWPLAELGQLRLRRGDLAGAEAAFLQAHEAGWSPQPGLALLRLAQGDAEAAARSIRDALDNPLEVPSFEIPPNTEVRRVPLLDAQVEIALGAGDIARARWAAGELEGIAAVFRTSAIQAEASSARGLVLLEDGDAAGARASLQGAIGLWRGLEAPYETAKARLGLARAHRVAGNLEGARLELGAARSTFERLGAAPEARRAVEMLSEIVVSPSAGTGGGPAGSGGRARRVFMFTDIVRSTDLVAAIGDDAWEHLLRWHDEMLRALVARHGGEVVQKTGDGFFVTFAEPGRALDGAVAVQRALAEHRREHGFAPRIRIGLHLADATRRGSDWSGKGVHVAARVGALADADEILASRETVEAARGDVVGLEPREVSLKGIAEPIEVVAVGWR